MKKLVIASMLAVTGFASAQNVTIGGHVGVSVDKISIGNANAARTGNTSEGRVSDQGSRFIITATEKLNNDLDAVAKFDLRFQADSSVRINSESNATAGQVTPNPISTGENFVGLSSKTFGTVRMGRFDVYYAESAGMVLTPAFLYYAAQPAPVFHSLATANYSRTPNMVLWDSPRVNGVQFSAGYSTQPLRTSNTVETEADLANSTRQRNGGGRYFKLNYDQGPLMATWARIDYKSDYIGSAAYATATGAVGANLNANSNQLGDTFLVKYTIDPQWQVAASWSNEKQTYVAAATSADTAYSYVPSGVVEGSTKQANAWNLAVNYKFGANTVTLSKTQRGNYKYNGEEALNTATSLTSLHFTHDLSKRTAVGIMYVSMNNGSKDATGLFSQTNTAFGGAVVNMVGERQNATSLTMRHLF